MSEIQVAREQAVHLLRLGHRPTAVAAELGRTPQWVRKCWRRYQALGWAGLQEQSRAPHQPGRQVTEPIRRAVIQARSELEAEAARGQGLKYIGGKAVRTRLKAKKIQPLPSVPTIERILRAAAMTNPRPKKAKVVYPRLRPDQAHQLYQVDHLPRYLQGGQKVYCFNALDVVSHYPTGQVACQRRATDAAAFLIHVWQRLGIPRYTQVDNEGCFSGGSTHPYVLAHCVRLALLVGTQLLFSPVNHPQSNGTVERFHQDYQAHVWQDTYLADPSAVQQQAEQFFELYRHSEHQAALAEQSPAVVHQQRPVPCLAEAFRLPTAKLPLYAGQIHFMRQVQANGTVSVLNVEWAVPEPDLLQGVWVTLELTPQQASLTIYNAAPDTPERTALVTYPFPLQEPVLPRPPVPTAHDPDLPNPTPSPEPASANPQDPLFANFPILWRWLPIALASPMAQPTQDLIRATLTRTANFVRNVAETIF